MIKIQCGGETFLELDELEEFQGELKKRTKKYIETVVSLIKKYGFSLVMGRQDYQWKHEPCLYGWKDGGHHKWNADRKQTTVIDFQKPSASESHPTMKPVGLFEYQIINSTNEGDVVLDTFGGSGTTIIACEKSKRRCRMMELDPVYCDVIRRRWTSWAKENGIKVGDGCLE